MENDQTGACLSHSLAWDAEAQRRLTWSILTLGSPVLTLKSHIRLDTNMGMC